jgi:hypothetical protein
MNIHVTRDSVCAADDCTAPNLFKFQMRADATITDIVSAIASSGKLPSIQGGKATWSVTSKEILAVIAQEWKTPRLTNLIEPNVEDLDFDSGILRIHLNYYAQMDPSVVLEVLERTSVKTI